MKIESPDRTRSVALSERRWLTEEEAAAHLSMTPKWLQKTRYSGGGPSFAKFGSAVRYAVSDIEEYERACKRTTTSDPGPRSAVGRAS